MKVANLVCLMAILFLSACSSNNTPKTQYYLLNSPTIMTSVVTENGINSNKDSTEIVSVKLSTLPEYLSQPNLVMHLSEHQLHYSNFHMWAEPLDQGIAKALAEELNNQHRTFTFSVLREIDANENSNIIINIDAFQATHQSQILLKGSYQINNDTLFKHAETLTHFDIRVDLDQDGYAHSVAKMRASIANLAKNITNKLSVK